MPRTGVDGWFSGKSLADVLSRLAERMRADYLPKTGTVLEMGCGAGDQSLLLAQLGYAMAGVDVAPTAIAWAKEKAAQRGLIADFRVGNVCDLNGFADESFDLALDGNCLHFVIGDDRKQFLESAFRVLKPGGWLLVTSVCDEPNAPIFAPGFDPVTRCYVQNGVACTYQGLAEDICREMRDAGFEIVWREIEPGVVGEQTAVLRLDARKPESPSAAAQEPRKAQTAGDQQCQRAGFGDA